MHNFQKNRHTAAGPSLGGTASSGGCERSKRGGLFFAAGLAAALLSGCATFVGDNRQALPVTSTPPGAQVLITDEAGRDVFRGITPTEAELPKSTGKYWGGKRFQVQISKEGHYPRTVTVTTRPNGWYLAGNLVFGGAIGWFLIDPWNGRMYSLSPDGIEATLPPIISGAHVVPARPAAPATAAPAPATPRPAVPAPVPAPEAAPPVSPAAPASAPTPTPASPTVPPAPGPAPAAAPASAPAPSPAPAPAPTPATATSPPPPPPASVPPIR